MLRQSPGFTLFEMLVVVLVIGLLALLVMELRRPHRERGRDRCNSNLGNSTNHGPDAPGQYVAVGAGSVEWWDNAYARPVQDKLGNATTDNIFADDIKLPDFPEDLETNIIN